MTTMSLNRIEQCYRELQQRGRVIQKLSIANPHEAGVYGPGNLLSQGYAEYFQRPTYEPDPKGAFVAREAIAQYYAARGGAVDPRHILLTASTSESFFYCFSLLAAAGDNVLTPTPSYPLFDEIARLAHVQLRPYHLQEAQGWRIDLESVRAALDDRTKAIVIISPHNPTGMVADRDTLQTLAELANARNIPLICDEVFSEFYFGPDDFPRAMSAATPDLCFTLNGISKMFALPAMKLAWIAVTGDSTRVASAVDRLELISDTFLSCHYPVQLALPTLFSRGTEFIQQYRQSIASRRAIAVEILGASPTVRFHPPMGGFTLMIEVCTDRWHDEDECVCDLMTHHGLFPHPGYFYDHERGVHLVLSLLQSEESLRDGLTRLCRAMSDENR